jgi:hypothetical protein
MGKFGAAAATLAATMLAACGSSPFAGDGGQAAEAPTYRVGDRWVYDAQDGFFRTVSRWRETHEVIAMSPLGITVRVTVKGDTINGERTEQWEAPGLVKIGALVDNETRNFPTPLKRYAFPLVPGKSWNQRINQIDEATRKEGPINRDVGVRSWQSVVTPAGTFDAIGMHVSMWLDDETFYRFPTSCSYLVQYSPAVRAMVHEEKECQYWEKSLSNAGGPIRSQHAQVDLVSFTPGAP